MKKIPEEYFTYNLQESLVLSSKAYAEKHLLPDDMSMCFTHGFNVGRFHLRRGCRPVCARLTTPPPSLYAVVCFCRRDFSNFILLFD